MNFGLVFLGMAKFRYKILNSETLRVNVFYVKANQ